MTQQQQLPLDFAKIARDKGIKKAVSHADKVHSEWSEQAYRFFKIWLSTRRGGFQMEDFRQHVAGVLPDPPSLRAFGGIAMRARHEGIIRRVGIKPVKNVKAHMANANVWQKV